MANKFKCFRACLLHLIVVFFFFSFFPATQSSTLVPIGQVNDDDASTSSDLCISMALSDFYSIHSSYTTRLSLFKRNYTDAVGALSGALDLLRNVGVHAIVGPRGSKEAGILAELGRKSHVPIISFSTSSPSLSPSSENPYSVRIALDDAFQVKPIVALLKGFGWYKVVLVHEDTENGNAIVPSLIQSLQDVQIQVSDKILIPTSAKDSLILENLNKIKKMWTRVFLVYMSASFGSRFFSLVDRSGMMSEGYVWIVMDGLSDELDASIAESMQGVLGIRPYVPKSEKLNNFTVEWKNKLSLVNSTINISMDEPNIYCLWGYDAIWALAFAAERIGPISNSSFSDTKADAEETNLLNLKISEAGPKLINEMGNIKFKGLIGEFNMVGGQLQPSSYEIINLVGSGIKKIGFWSPRYGFSREFIGLRVGKPARYSTSTSNLKTIVWPGDSTVKPKGWEAISITGGNKLKIATPYKGGFPEFVNMSKNPITNTYYNFTGFTIDVFKLVWENLTYKVPYKFEAYVNPEGEASSYDELVCSLKEKTYDIAVGDITIRANRTSCAEFTMPYSENGVSMLVKKTQRRNNDMWIFLHPLSWDLWVTIFVLCLFTGVSIIVLERNVDNGELDGSARKKLGMIFWFPFQAIMIPQRDLVVKNCSRFVLVLWLFVAFVLMQSYTANLSSILVVDQLKPSYPSVQYLREKGYAVGYQNGSFVEDFLVSTLEFDPSKIKAYACIQEYHKALSDGPEKGGVAAIFDEIPYLKVFLAKYGSGYTMAGPKYTSQGFGFAFPMGSPLVSDFSKAILNFFEGQELIDLTKQHFGNSFEDNNIDTTDGGAPSLTTSNFGGLFLLVGILTVSSIVVSETYDLKRLKLMFSRPNSSGQNDSSRYYSSDGLDGTGAAEHSEEANVRL